MQKRNLKIFLLMAVVATLFTACLQAPEGNSWDYKNVKEDGTYSLSSGSKYRGTGFITKTGGSAVWFFENNTDTTIKCKYTERCELDGHSDLELWIPHEGYNYKTYEGIKNKKEFEVPPGVTLRIHAASPYRIKSGGSSESFFKFYLACH